MLSAIMSMMLGLAAGATSSLTTSARLESFDRTFFLFVTTSAALSSGAIVPSSVEPLTFRSSGIGDSPVLPESRLQPAIGIKKIQIIANLYRELFMINVPPLIPNKS